MDLTFTASPFEVMYTLGGLFVLFAFIVLLIFALRDQIEIRKVPEQHPDRMVAADSIVNEFIRIILGVGLVAIGAAAMLTPPPPFASATSPSILGVTLFTVLIVWEFLLLTWGFKDLWFRRRLFGRMAEIRIICGPSTYADCPFVNSPMPHDHKPRPESLVEPPVQPLMIEPHEH